MKVIVAGSRDIDDKVIVYAAIDKVVNNSDLVITELVTGMCRGPDMIGYQYAREKGIATKEFPANWSLGPSAGPIRNREMAEYADVLIAIWDGKSKGTFNMIEEAMKRKLVVVVEPVSAASEGLIKTALDKLYKKYP